MKIEPFSIMWGSRARVFLDTPDMSHFVQRAKNPVAPLPGKVMMLAEISKLWTSGEDPNVVHCARSPRLGGINRKTRANRSRFLNFGEMRFPCFMRTKSTNALLSKDRKKILINKVLKILDERGNAPLWSG